MPELHDITEPNAFFPEPTTPWWVWVLVALALIIIALVSILIIKKRSKQLTHKSAREEAQEELSQLREISPEIAVHETATELSLILRRYLSRAFKDPALFETDEEFTIRSSALTSLDEASKQKLTSLLSELSQLKYLPTQKNDAQQLVNDFIDQTDAMIDIVQPESSSTQTSGSNELKTVK